MEKNLKIMDIHICITESWYYTPESNSTVKQLYSNIKIKIKKKESQSIATLIPLANLVFLCCVT